MSILFYLCCCCFRFCWCSLAAAAVVATPDMEALGAFAAAVLAYFAVEAPDVLAAVVATPIIEALGVFAAAVLALCFCSPCCPFCCCCDS